MVESALAKGIGKTLPNRVWDVIVVGGGPSGLLAAGLCGAGQFQNGDRPAVLLLEKKEKPGRKLLLTGSGRCNISNIGIDNEVGGHQRSGPPGAVREAREMALNFGSFPSSLDAAASDPFVAPGPARELVTLLSACPPSEIARLLGPDGILGLPLVEAERGRLFPESDSARDVLQALEQLCVENGVVMRTGARVSNLEKSTENSFIIIMSDGTRLQARRVILAVGGRNYPVTGSEGDALPWLNALGLDTLPFWPALVPLLGREKWPVHVAGLGLPDVGLSVWWTDGAGDARQVVKAQRGPIMFTHRGISGPVVLHLSARLVRMANLLSGKGRIELRIDLVPDQTVEELTAWLDGVIQQHPHRLLRNELGAFGSQAMADVVCTHICGLDAEITLGKLARPARRALIAAVKGLPLTWAGHEGWDVAISSAGGLHARELDWASMECRSVPGLHVLGDLVSLDRKSGGYSLMICWASARVASLACLKALEAISHY